MPTPPAAGELARVEIFRGVLGRGGPSPAVSAFSALDALETCCAFGVHGLMVLIEECGHHCAGRSVPGHVHEPLTDESHHAPARDRTMADPEPEPARCAPLLPAAASAGVGMTITSLSHPGWPFAILAVDVLPRAGFQAGQATAALTTLLFRRRYHSGDRSGPDGGPGQRLPRPARQPLAVGGDAPSLALQLLVRRATQPRRTPDA